MTDYAALIAAAKKFQSAPWPGNEQDLMQDAIRAGVLIDRLIGALRECAPLEGWDVTYSSTKFCAPGEKASVFRHPTGCWLLNNGGAVYGGFPAAAAAMAALEGEKQ